MKNINESAMLDMYFVYKFAKYIGKPFKKWEAYDTGVIDKKGNLLLKNNLTSQQKDSYTFFHRLVRNLKQLLEKVPGMKSKLGKAVAAYFLFKEQMVKHGTNGEMLDEAFIEYCNESMPLNESMQIDTLMKQHMLVESIK
jgi:hypothetical protein